MEETPPWTIEDYKKYAKYNDVVKAGKMRWRTIEI